MQNIISKLVLASANQGKLKEMQALLKPLNIEVIPQSEFNIQDIEETGTTFIENALIKALHTTKITGLPAIADDSGLIINALGGAPGVYSARYGNKDNYHPKKDTNNCYKVLDKLKGIKNRQAQFVSVITLCLSETHPLPIIAQGTWQGEIAEKMTGDYGFGYDPIFYLPSLNQTAAQLPDEQKNMISHRAIAMQSLITQLKNQ